MHLVLCKGKKRARASDGIANGLNLMVDAFCTGMTKTNDAMEHIAKRIGCV